MIDPEHLALARKLVAENPTRRVGAETIAHLRVLFGELDPCVTSLSRGSSTV
jgi:hypothetical protein